MTAAHARPALPEAKPRRRLEAVTVCVGFAEELAACASNRAHFDRWIIVTTEDDDATRAVCEQHGLERVVTTRLHDHRAHFNKGRALNDGLDALDLDDWVVALDADVLLPVFFRDAFERQRLETHVVYTSMFRALCADAGAARAFLDDFYGGLIARKKSAARSLAYRALCALPRGPWTNPLWDAWKATALDRYEMLTDGIVNAERRRRARFVRRLNAGGERHWDAGLTQDEVCALKRDWLAAQGGDTCMERNDFRLGFLQLFHAASQHRFSERFRTAGEVDVDFFERFADTVEETPGSMTQLRVHHRGYLEVPEDIAVGRNQWLVCAHIGAPYTHWKGRG